MSVWTHTVFKTNYIAHHWCYSLYLCLEPCVFSYRSNQWYKKLVLYVWGTMFSKTIIGVEKTRTMCVFWNLVFKTNYWASQWKRKKMFLTPCFRQTEKIWEEKKFWPSVTSGNEPDFCFSSTPSLSNRMCLCHIPENCTWETSVGIKVWGKWEYM